MSATKLGHGSRSEFCSTADGVLDHIFDNWLRYSAGLVMHGVGGLTGEGAYWWNHLRRGHVREHDHVNVYPSFYVTGKGYIGAGPPDTRLGDGVVCLIGAPSFSLVRRRSGKGDEFQGFTYLSLTAQRGYKPEL